MMLSSCPIVGPRTRIVGGSVHRAPVTRRADVAQFETEYPSPSFRSRPDSRLDQEHRPAPPLIEQSRRRHRHRHGDDAEPCVVLGTGPTRTQPHYLYGKSDQRCVEAAIRPPNALRNHWAAIALMSPCCSHAAIYQHHAPIAAMATITALSHDDREIVDGVAAISGGNVRKAVTGAACATSDDRRGRPPARRVR